MPAARCGWRLANESSSYNGWPRFSTQWIRCVETRTSEQLGYFQFMEQLILHLLGDFVFQSDWMANNKTKRSWPAFCHVMVYGLPFLLIGSPAAVGVICATHFFIDRYRLVRYLNWTKNWLSPLRQPWAECSVTGFHKSTPEWMATWLMIIADATIHLICNYCALCWF